MAELVTQKDAYVNLVFYDLWLSTRIKLADKCNDSIVCRTIAKNHPCVEFSTQGFKRELAGWMRNRSPENYLWIHSLTDVIRRSLQDMIVNFMEVEDDPEFEELEILIGANSCVRQLRVFCFPGSSPDIMGPAHKAAARFGKQKPSLLGGPGKWGRKRRSFISYLKLYYNG